MTKILVFDVREDELPALEQWKAAHQDDVEVELIEAQLDASHLVKLADVDGISISQTTQFDSQFYKVLAENGIFHIAQRSAGYDQFDLEAANLENIKISNVPSYSPQSIAEFAVTRTLELVRHTAQIDRNMAQNDFTWNLNLQGRTVESLKIGVLGTGRIGSRAAKIFKGFGSEVLAYDIAPDEALNDVVTYVDSLETLISQVDVLTLHIPGSKENHYLINEDVLKQAKPGLLLINAARGSVVDTTALIRSIEAGHVAGVAIDTYENEGAYFRHDWGGRELEDETLKALLNHEKVLLSPHVAFYTDEAVKNLVDIPLNDVLSFIRTRQAENIVNP
ncbi:D-2-hydroxyacid dehydrogenase [Staphylococcus pseudintermedius]|uniref:D-2-hydroxyacid dehydrogenase n=1 Tax=Staphylococcus pseudintermedius TaxID=283734 RepID=UPI000CFB161F|nr:D-2-hydroxyacid dehydrogenase [Staphylococcus pseudintermedius]EGQ0291388.1 D-2-hydroxyacid dehydrogenase [Staphylococcus pseudintermedius]EGQ0311590.1 D-2-hydroxyacid dehydrogenase [Staphylococcus pseudintermedius]EGQ0357081.1 D-2-hydroxyacid dehydrogenase [Staphylococcus pseudintermedius]EGQ0378240.1 D-2-hydroxyacid dehydrogenase [Staphylococcus pseudintermedius]EGQ0388910.1 D-2-hydroxyacid dehydrogenase [Staphylococcus pseudintermedius]